VDLLALDPTLEGALDRVSAALHGGLDIACDAVRALAVRAAMVDERAAYSERGRPRAAYVGGSARCAALIELLVTGGLPNPGELLRCARYSLEVVNVLLRVAAPSQADIDAALLATCDEHSYDPIENVIVRLLGAGPSASAIDETLRRAAAGTARFRGVALDLRFFDVFDRLLAAGAHADHAAGSTETALHVLVTLVSPTAAGDRNREKRVARAEATTARAIASVCTVNIVDGNGFTPLHAACWYGIVKRVSMLLEAGAERERRDGQGKAAAEYANGNAEVLAALGLPPPAPPAPRTLPSPKHPPPPAPDPFPIGTRVSHPTFGDGVVTASQGLGASRKLTIRFANDGTRVLAASFVEWTMKE
jgi:hypothetical protein